MKQRIFYLIKLYLFFVVFFLFSKIIFLIYYSNLTFDAGVINALPIFFHGLRLDLSAAGYLMLLPIVMLLLSSVVRIDIFSRIMPWYNGLLVVLLSLILVSDLELYKYWGFRLDATPLLYIKTPKEALASVSIWVIVRQVFIAVVIIILSFVILIKFKSAANETFKLYEIPVYLFLLAFMIIPIRGGFGIAPINVGSAYFSQNSFLNHAAINVYWNLGNSFADQNDKTNNYNYFPEKQADLLVKNYLNENDTTGEIFINSEKPNIVLIMMESFTANVIEPLGGLPGITPSLNKLADEGILFTNIYASGDRSDKGLMSILSGYPAQTSYSVIKDAAKTQSLPKLPLDLKKHGYGTAFYYGGDLNFANMRSYLVSAGFTHLISKDDFPSSTYNSKWGAHDEVVFDKLFQDLKNESSPFFKMIFTLSSHEPFEVPVQKIRGNDETSKFLNSVQYTDSCLGDFIQKAKKEVWWEDTWIIIVADHGMRLPGNLKVHDPKKFHIPFLWMGGAIDKKLKIEKTASQVDIPVTILNQLGLSTREYIFSRNMLGKIQKTDAFYIYNNGIAMVNDSTKLIYDFSNNAILENHGAVVDSMVNVPKSYIQKIYSDLNKRRK